MMENFHRIQPPVFPVEKVVIPEINTVRLNNNVPVYLIEAGTEDIMRMEFTFRAGQVKENLPLLASATNMMLSEGSQNFTSEELNRTLDYHGAFLNLSCDKDRAGMVIFFLNKHVKKIIELSREILFRPLFPDNEYNSLMKKKLRWFLVNREKVQNIAMDQFFESVFGKTHPYGQQVRENDFSNLSPALLRDFHSKYYTIENMAIIISGKIAHNTIDILNQYIGDISSYKNNPEIISKKPEGSPEKKIHLIKPGAVQTAIRIGSATINKRHSDYPGLKIMDSILGGYFGSRLMKNIREEKGYTYGISSGVSSLDLTGYKIISTDVRPENCQKVLNEIYKEIRLLQNEPVKNSEMELVRNYMSGEMLRMFDGPFALAESFRSAWEFGLDNNYYYRLAEKIRSIDPDEITWLARTYYNIDELYEVTVGQE
jgi:zinc protease